MPAQPQRKAAPCAHGWPAQQRRWPAGYNDRAQVQALTRPLMARKRRKVTDALTGITGANTTTDEPTAPVAEVSAPQPAPDVVLRDKSQTSGGMLRRTVYFTRAEWAAVLQASQASTLETGENVTASEVVRRAVRAALDLD